MLMLQGYFASWATVVTAAMALGFTASAFQTSVKGLGALMGLLASSIIVIIALIDWVGGGIFRAESIYAMVVACITVVLVLAHIYKEKKEGDGDGGGMVMFGVLAFFSVLWLVLACLVTFRGPFIATGNGYFASVSVILIRGHSCPLLLAAMRVPAVQRAAPTAVSPASFVKCTNSLLFALFLHGCSGPELHVHALPALPQSATQIRILCGIDRGGR